VRCDAGFNISFVLQYQLIFNILHIKKDLLGPLGGLPESDFGRFEVFCDALIR
jgi:hypothetical protein